MHVCSSGQRICWTRGTRMRRHALLALAMHSAGRSNSGAGLTARSPSGVAERPARRHLLLVLAVTAAVASWTLAGGAVAASAASLATDKADYHPEEVVHIT